MGSNEVKNRSETFQKPMTYSESVKQAKPRCSPVNASQTKQEKSHYSSSNETPMATKPKRELKSKLTDKIMKERDELNNSIEIMKSKLKQAKASFDGLIAEKEKTLREKIDQLNDYLLLLKPIVCSRTNCQHQQASCIPAHGKITQLNDRIVRKVISSRNLISELKEKLIITRRRKEIKKDLLLLFMRISKGKDDGFQITGRRKGFEENYKQLERDLQRLISETTHVQQLCLSSEPLKAEEFMKNRISQLADYVEGRTSAVAKIKNELEEADSIYKEKRAALNSLQEQIKKIRKEFSEPIINRIQYNLCLKENIKYDKDLNKILEERDEVQDQYGAVMEEYKDLGMQAQAEENCKEKLFMDIISQVEEGRKHQLEHESMVVRTNQMHAEIAVRHAFMHAGQETIDDLTAECKELNYQLIISAAEEDVLREENKKIAEKLTEILFDICFYKSLMAVGEEEEEKKEREPADIEEKV